MVKSTYLTAGGVVQRTGSKASQVTEVLKQVEARHADGFWLQLWHLQTRLHTFSTYVNTQLSLKMLQQRSLLCTSITIYN